MRIDILTIFPEMFSNILSSSILGRAASKGILKFKTHNIRDFSQNKHRNTDDYPFGGGAGMVMLAQPIFDCIESVAAEAPESRAHCDESARQSADTGTCKRTRFGEASSFPCGAL